MNGLYGYWDNVKHKVVYIGQAKNIRDRLKAHMKSSLYDAQQINKVIQNNPERYESFIFVEGDFTTEELNELEYEAVEIFKTNRYKYPENEGFNFKDGGDAKEMPEETKKKISESLKGNSGENHPKWKGYARIIKYGYNWQRKQRYGIKFNGKIIKQSISIDKLEKLFKENYPDEELVIDEGIKHQ